MRIIIATDIFSQRGQFSRRENATDKSAKKKTAGD